MDEVYKHAEDIENIGQMLSRIGEPKYKKKDSFEMNEEDCEDQYTRESPKGCEQMELPLSSNKENIDINPGYESPPIRSNLSPDKVICPSEDAVKIDALSPCGTCGRSFNQNALERHLKICEKVSSKLPRKVLDFSNVRTKDLDPAPRSTYTPLTRKKSSNKPEDDFKTCPYCNRKFGLKPFDRHVSWCGEKSRRLQDSPKKDMIALAKLHARNSYRPQTPNRKGSSGSISGASPAPTYRKDSMSSSCYTPTVFDRLSVSRKGSTSPPSTRSLSRSMSLRDRRSSGGISYLKENKHTNETENTHFIRSATGRGSIKRGPAPTKSSVLRQQAKEKELQEKAQQGRPRMGSIRQNVASPLYASSRYNPSPLSQRVTSPGGYSVSSNQGYMSSSYRRPSNTSINQQLVKPSVVRPLHKTSSYGMRREPEGIEHDSDNSKSEAESTSIIRGSYDHSQEYDPYQSAAKQMQELLFGITSSNNSSSAAANLRPSTNSAFQKYIPGNDVPSTADINNKFGGGGSSSVLGNSSSQGGKSRLDSYLNLPSSTRRTSGGDTMVAGQGSQFQAPSMSNSYNVNPRNSGQIRVTTTDAGAKVARFCHECGNPFAMPNIRFCCECGVKRLYC